MTCQLLLATNCTTDVADHACKPCLNTLRRVTRQALADLPALHLTITRAEHLDPPAGHTPAGPRIPINTHALDVEQACRARLVPWLREHAARTGQWPTADTLGHMLALIAERLPDWRHDDTIAYLAADLHWIRDTIHQLVDLDQPARIDAGPCPVQHPETADWCTGRVTLHAPRERSQRPLLAACKACGSEWSPAEFSGLELAISRRRGNRPDPDGEAHAGWGWTHVGSGTWIRQADVAAIAGVTTRTVRQAADKEGWRVAVVQRQACYAWPQVAAWLRRREEARESA